MIEILIIFVLHVFTCHSATTNNGAGGKGWNMLKYTVTERNQAKCYKEFEYECDSVGLELSNVAL